MNPSKVVLPSAILFCAVGALTAAPLRVHPTNPRYFTDGTKNADGSLRAVYLTGAHTWNNLVDMDKADPPAPFDFGAYLDFLERHGHNFIRLWTWDSFAWDSRANGKLGRDFVHHVAPLPWARTGPGNALDGKPKFDLTKFNPEYFDRLRTRVRAAGARGIYVSVMLFEGWGLSHANRRVPDADGWAYRSHPFHPDNNINGITGDLNGDGNVLEIHSLASDAITALQAAYIRKVVDTVNDLDNVLYEVINEGGNQQWDWWVVKTIKDCERTKPKQHPVGITGHGGERLATMVASPADWISPGSQDGFRDPPPAWDGPKVSLLDTDHVWGVGGNPGWVWRSFLRGHNPLFMDPYDGAILGVPNDPRWEPVRVAMGVARRLADRIDLAAMTPHGELASSGFCLADPGQEYVVYAPEGGEVTVDLAGAGPFAVEWIHPTEGKVVTADGVSGGAKRPLRAPFSGDAVLHLKDQGKQQAQGTDIPIPPAEHPRLYLRAEHVAQLPQRLQEPTLRQAVEGLRSLARRSAQGQVEWDALQYLVTHDEKLGRATIEAALPLLQKCELANKQDACRETGRMMVTGAIVYDWCYSLLTPDEKQAFIKELVRLAKTQECGYPPVGQGSVTGHASEAMIMRDMLSAGIAIYDEFPEMYRLAAGRFFREHLPVRNWFYPGHAYHQGDSYGPHRYSWDTYPLWIFDRLGAGNVYNPEQRFVPYWWIYTTRPDGQRLRAGDTFACSAPRGRPWSQYLGTLLTASYYHDGILLDQYRRQGGSGGNETIFEVLWRDTSLQPKSIATLPLSWYSGSPFGWTVARTGWDENAVIAEMKVNEYNFVNHQHLDAGAFQIYYKGALAVDSGVYQGGSAGGYGSTHCLNYSWRTIAHNSLLVYDPNEKFGGRGYGNDGGQRLPHGRSEARNLEVLLAPQNGYRTGKVLAHGFGPDPQTPDFTWLQGDLTQAYGPKVREVTRSFVFLNLRNAQVPAAMVVFDRVAGVNPAFRKQWLLHTLEEPRIDGTSAVVECTEHGSTGRLTLDTLLPTTGNADLGKVGGPGKEYWVFGQNWSNDIDPQRRERTSVEPGAWRIELSPKASSTEDLFLNVMQVTDRRSPSHWPVRRLDAGGRVGCLIEGPEASWIVLMRKDSRRSAEPVKFTIPGDRPGRILVTDLTPGPWRARLEDSSETRNLTVNEDSGTAWFEGPAGTWTLSR